LLESVFFVNPFNQLKLFFGLFRSAIRACKPGGIVVYSTCTLAPVQNEGVVERAIENLRSSSSNKKQRGYHGNAPIKCEIVSTQSLEKNFAYFFEFHAKTRYGSLVLPHISKNFGPLYFCKIRRIR
jgi:16S rRNA C967 or C1407 C5-methylase (RsmB/RsmF family)